MVDVNAAQQITAALDEADAALDWVTALPWREAGPDGGRYAAIVSDEPPTRRMSCPEDWEAYGGYLIGESIVAEDRALIVSVVNRERAQIHHARNVLARHRIGPTINWKKEHPDWIACFGCGVVIDGELDCPEVASLLAVWCPEPTP